MSGWRLAQASVAGRYHRDCGRATDDAFAVRQIERDGEQLLLVVLADGAGSARCGGEAAALSCQSAAALIGADLAAGCRADPAAATRWLLGIREGLAQRAAASHNDLDDYASTLLLSVLDPRHGAFYAQLGDGAIVRRDALGCAPVFWPDCGDYANQTHFLSDGHWQQWLRWQHDDRLPLGLCLFSDGLQHLALDYAQQCAHGPFFEPLFLAARNCPPGAEATLSARLQALLSAPAVEARSSDDRSLLLIWPC